MFLTVAFLCFFLVCGMASSGRASERMVVVGVYDSPPLSSTKDLKEDRGMLLKILRYVANRERWSLKYVPGTLSELQALLENGQIDLLVGAPYSKEHADKYRFTRDTTISTWAQIYSRRPSNIQSLLDLKNLTVGVVKEDPYNGKIREAVKSFDINCTFLEFNNYDEVMQALGKGWIDAGIIDRLFGAMQEGGRKVYRTSVILSPIEIRFAARNELSEQLISPLDYHLEKLKQNQDSLYYRLLNQIDTVKDDSKLLMILRWGLIVAAVLVLVFVAESILLQRQVKRKTSELLRNNEELEKEIRARKKIEASLKEELDQRKLIEKALKESEERYRNVFESTGTANIIIEEDMTISMANARAVEMSGYTRDKLIGRMKISDFLADGDREKAIRHHLNRIMNKPGQPNEYEIRMMNREGGFSEVMVTVGFIPETCQSIASIIDITERRQNEQERLRLATALEQSTEGVIITDTNHLIQYVNPVFEQLTGYSREETIGETPFSIMGSPADGAVLPGRSDSDKTGNGWRGRITCRKKDGTTYKTLTCISPIRDGTGNIINYVITQRDISVEDQLEGQLRQSQKMEAIGTLAGGIAHDFNNILSPIIGFAELALADVPAGSPVSHKLERVIQAGQRAKDLVNQILTFSRQKEQEAKPVEMKEIVKEALKLIRATIPTTIEIRQDIEDDTGLIMGDITQVHQVLMNLCTNAYHAMQDAGGILGVVLENVDVDECSAAKYLHLQPGSYVRLTVSDTGYGMDKKTLERIFEPFFTTKKQSEGTGLGLSIVHGIVKSMGGAITVYSEPGEGTTFKLYFPRIDADTALEASGKKYLSTGSEKILYVDDEELVAEMAQEMLESLGYTVSSRTSSVEALRVFKATPDLFDLVITDQTMPNMTGIELAAEIRKIRSAIPVVLCTGFSETILLEKAKSSGIREIILKPFIKQEFSDIIRKVLDAQKDISVHG
jgi:PAS domain S-box-containing protein